MDAASVIVSQLEVLPGLRLIYLFGSRAQGRAAPDSDWDIAIVTDSPIAPADRHRRASELARALGGSVDLVPLERAPIELAWAVIATGRLLHERTLADRVEYEADIQSRYGDHLPVLRAQRAETLLGDNHEAGVRRYREALGALGRLPREAGRAPGTDP